MNLNNNQAQQQAHPKQCRICLHGQNQLIVPCNCTGSVKFVHEECMREWAKQALQKAQKNNELLTCQLCKSQLYYSSSFRFRCHSSHQIISKIKKTKLIFSLLILIIIVAISTIITLAFLYVNRSAYIYGKNSSTYDWVWWLVLGILSFCALILLKSLYNLCSYLFRFGHDVQKILPNPNLNNVEQTRQMTNLDSTNHYLIKTKKKPQKQKCTSIPHKITKIEDVVSISKAQLLMDETKQCNQSQMRRNEQ